MKKYLSLFVLSVALVMIFTISDVAKAEEAGTFSDTDSVKTDLKQKRKEIKNEIKNKRDEFKIQAEVKRKELKQQIETTREEAKQKMRDLKEKVKGEKDTAKVKIKELRIAGREKALERFDAAVLRIDNLKGKISAQIVKFEARGVAVAKAKDFVATAETKLNEAKAKKIEANKLFSVSSEELTSENKTTLRTLTKEIQTLIKESHKALNNAVKSLRDSIKAMLEDLKNATKTEENNDEDNSGNN